MVTLAKVFPALPQHPLLGTQHYVVSKEGTEGTEGTKGTEGMKGTEGTKGTEGRESEINLTQLNLNKLSPY
jgi:hypothetical protein